MCNGRPAGPKHSGPLSSTVCLLSTTHTSGAPLHAPAIQEPGQHHLLHDALNFQPQMTSASSVVTTHPPLLTEKLHYMRAFQCPPRIRGIAGYFPIFPGTPCVPGGQRIGWIPFSVEWRGTPIRNKTKGPRLYLRKRGVRHNSRKRAPVSVLSFLFGQAQREEKERWGMALRRQLRR